jgi:hypothetical protein
MSQNGRTGVYLLANQEESPPRDWSQHVRFFYTVVNQTDEKCNVMGRGLHSSTFQLNLSRF